MVNPVPGFSEKVDFVIQRRFRKLYRRLYNAFFIDDFIHKRDYEKVVELLNQRITMLEAQLNAATAANAAAISGLTASTAAAQTSMHATLATHTHPVQVVPVTGTGATIGIVVAPPPPTPPVPGAPVPAATQATGQQAVQMSKTHPEHTAKDSALRALGPEFSPLVNIPPMDPETTIDSIANARDTENI